MALTLNIIEVQPTNGNDNNSGMFCGFNGPTLPTNLAATNGNTASPTVTSATYNFVAGDVGAYLFIKTGTNWIPGLYQIVSVAANAATLGRAVATVASPTIGTWCIDYSQQGPSQFNGTNLTVDATTNTDVAPDGHTPAPADIGNAIHITAGAGFTQGWYQINLISAGKWRLDRSPAAVGTSGGTWALGGALQTLGTAATAFTVSGARIYVKAESTCVLTAGITLSVGTAIAGVNPTAARFAGYSNARGDNGKATIQLSTNTGLTAINVTGQGWIIENLLIDCNSLGTSKAITLTGAITNIVVRNCKVINYSSTGITTPNAASNSVMDCEVTGGISPSTFGITLGGAGGGVARCWVHDNVGGGMNIAGPGTPANFNLVTNNSGATSDGIQATNGSNLANNTVYKSGRHGIFFNGGLTCNPNVKGNLLSENGGYGIAGNVDSVRDYGYDGNAFYLNTSGTRNNLDNITSSAGVAYVGTYTNVLDVILTADPFTNKAGDDYTLNNTAGGGAACRGTNDGPVGGSIAGNAKVSYQDFGAYQHLDAGGSVAPALAEEGMINVTTRRW